jgi:hypothetical protein
VGVGVATSAGANAGTGDGVDGMVMVGVSTGVSTAVVVRLCTISGTGPGSWESIAGGGAGTSTVWRIQDDASGIDSIMMIDKNQNSIVFFFI